MKQPQPVAIHGAGGHGRVVAEAAAAAGFRVVGFIDDAPAPAGPASPMLSRDDPRLDETPFIVGIGEAASRRRVHEQLLDQGRTLISVIHPRAWVSPSAELGPGVFVGPGAVIHTEAVLEPGVIVNTHAVVEHQCRVDAFAHVAPGATLGGRACVGEAALVGINASVLPGLTVAREATVGAGAVVTREVNERQTVVGVPAVVRPRAEG